MMDHQGRAGRLALRDPRAVRGKKLACHCMGFPCHAEIIAILANEPADAMGALCRACE